MGARRSNAESTLMSMSMPEFLDRYIKGESGAYYFDIEIASGKQLSGGMFSYKKDARNRLFAKLVRFLDDCVEAKV